MEWNEFYCEKKEEGYKSFDKSLLMAEMRGAKTENVVKVRLDEVEEGEDVHAVYYVKDGVYKHVYDDILKVKICSTDWFNSKIESGAARFVKLKVVEME